MHAAISQALNQVFDEQTLARPVTESAFAAIMDGECSETDIAAFLTALRVRGEAFEEIAGAAHVMRSRATRIPCSSSSLLDTCGTGGDSLHTYNISTATAFVAAGAGVAVAKHGNRSVSSSSGSADVLEQLGVNLQLTPEQVGECVDEIGLGFCFAPLLHSAMKNVVPVRKALGFRTIFNLLGPLTNPAGAQFQLLGSNRIAFAEKLAAALAELGCERAFVVCGNDELDEVSLWGETTVFDVTNGNVARTSWTAADFGLEECSVDELKVGSPAESAAKISSVLNGELGAARDIVVANAAAGLLAVGQASSPLEGARIAQAAIDDGKAKAVMAQLIEKTNQLANQN
jgi:anthranilate phosphoribosyltransferase